MHMWVKPPGELDARMEILAPVLREAFLPEFKASIHEFHVGAFSEGVVDDRFVLVDSNRAC